jgi:hypothetical protein
MSSKEMKAYAGGDIGIILGLGCLFFGFPILCLFERLTKRKG